MVEKDKIKKLFESSTFRKHSIYFYQEQKSVSEVTRESGVSRSTIYDHFDMLKKEGYYDSDYLLVKGGGRDVPYKLTQKILVDWLDELLSLNRKERNLLNKIIQKEKVDSLLRSFSSWDAVIMMLGGLLTDAIFFEKKIEEIPPKDILSKGTLASMQTFTEREDKELVERNKRLVNAIYEASEPITKSFETAEKLLQKMLNAKFPFDSEKPVRIIHSMILTNFKYAKLFERLENIKETELNQK
ncbi:hypothetical protein AKJ51_00290 [candidate division MSBL1 archaeon SCGC-AAA382A20]|uniref:Uncharacterized protein n=1 Tax=candidate division MSBL1 archaeon SCGC-AAA382A20 TaxID=1698280 RepID=A0A133VMN6_9EURY|nr:hypothetical protein AKJ51_00290 [candidate division MSBL1 archaeon SCGC-AAA382A20]